MEIIAEESARLLADAAVTAFEQGLLSPPFRARLLEGYDVFPISVETGTQMIGLRVFSPSDRGPQTFYDVHVSYTLAKMYPVDCGRMVIAHFQRADQLRRLRPSA